MFRFHTDCVCTPAGKDHSNKQRSGQEESPHLPKGTHSLLDTLSEEPTDRDAADHSSTTGDHTDTPIITVYLFEMCGSCDL